MSIYSAITPLLHNAKSNISRFGSAIQVLGDYYAKAIFGGQICDETSCWRDNSLEGSSRGGNLPAAICWGQFSGGLFSGICKLPKPTFLGNSPLYVVFLCLPLKT